MKCLFCGEEIPSYRRSFCSQLCYSKYSSIKRRRETSAVKPQPAKKIEVKTSDKSLADWCKEADQCNLDYGTYRALREQGKSFDEIKAQNHVRQVHAHGKAHLRSD